MEDINTTPAARRAMRTLFQRLRTGGVIKDTGGRSVSAMGGVLESGIMEPRCPHRPHRGNS